MKDAHRYIAENRSDIRRTAATFIEAAERQSIDLTFGRNLVETTVSVEVYKRDLSDTLVVGHPNAADHGIAGGKIGDHRAGWTSVTTSTETAVFTRAGRTALRDALDGQTGGIREAGIGTGTADAASGDTALGNLTAKVNAAAADAERPDAETARGIGVWRFHEHANAATEFGLYNTDGSLLCRLTLPTDAAPTAEEEVRAEIDLGISGEGIGDSVVTNAGEEAIADALHFPTTTVALNEIALGSGSSTFSKSSTALTTEEFRRTVIRELELEAIRAETRVYPGEPSGSLPITLSEMAVYDNASTPRMLWATTFDDEEKTDGVSLRAGVGFLLE